MINQILNKTKSDKAGKIKTYLFENIFINEWNAKT